MTLYAETLTVQQLVEDVAATAEVLGIDLYHPRSGPIARTATRTGIDRATNGTSWVGADRVLQKFHTDLRTLAGEIRALAPPGP